jgi:hypothetical protein
MILDRHSLDSERGWYAVNADGSHAIGPLSKSAAEAAVAINLDYRLAYGERGKLKFTERAAPH